MKAHVIVTLKPGILDPQGEAVRQALATLDGVEVERVRVGKYIEVELGEADPSGAMTALRAMCDKLLANPVMEDYRIELVEG
ncbi:MAG: phosphoribosylformylglycinamidine synthase subunit PurS [Nitrospinae bacterium]|nr:phosphoribosylformylglycinamidine synthase subunit PurS [Nitrospinota bacterium]